MPPVRTIGAIKPQKTERTHEENQERAYIAASRRSDRSLEARIESARRASEIHKRRTGRSLRVTEQDVINEEMYEEEDDDLPAQYRRLTAHLQTQNPMFDRRLNAYMANQVAMRSALMMAQQYPNLNFQQQPSPMQQMPQQSYPTPMLPPQMGYRSQSYRQAPYSVPSPQNSSLAQRRAASFSSPHPAVSPYSNVSSPVDVKAEEQRRMSMPPQQSAPSLSPGTPQAQQQPTPQTQPSLSRSSSSTNIHAEATPHSVFKEGNQQNFSMSMPQPNVMNYMSPLTTTLPPESQMMLNGASMDPTDPFTAALMGHNPMMSGYGNPMMQHHEPRFYSYNPNATKARNFHPSFDSMNQTLAPGALEGGSSPWPSSMAMPHPDKAFTAASSMGSDMLTAPSMGFGFDNFDLKLPPNMTRNNSSHGSLLNTPGVEGEWNSFIDNAAWDEGATVGGV